MHLNKTSFIGAHDNPHVEQSWRKPLRRPSKIVPKSNRLWKLLKLLNLERQHPKMFGKKGSKIPKLPPVRNCFTLTMTNKLVVIINSFRVSKIKKPLLYEMKFFVPNSSCLQNRWLGGYRPQTPFSLSSVLNWICWTPSPRTKFLGTPLLHSAAPWGVFFMVRSIARLILATNKKYLDLIRDLFEA